MRSTERVFASHRNPFTMAKTGTFSADCEQKVPPVQKLLLLLFVIVYLEQTSR